jgi:UDP-2,4-diacetamido-2,4,6-trideoxy-beta-L-altropyranose hydrolase
VNALIRCDGSCEIGMGHITRCLVLADSLNKSNINVIFAVAESKDAIEVIKNKFNVIKLIGKENKKKSYDLEEIIVSNAIQILILDIRNDLSKAELIKLKNDTKIKVVTIDDPEEKRIASDLAVYPPVPQLNNMSWDGYKGKLLIGWEYVIIDKKFGRKFKQNTNRLPNLLICMGGSDKNDMTNHFVNSVSKLNLNINITIVVGLGYKYIKKLKYNTTNINCNYKLQQNPSHIEKIISNCDAALISFGQLAYEVAAMNIPALYINISKDHETSCGMFVKAGLGISLGLYNRNVTSEIYSNKIKELLKLEIKDNPVQSDVDNISTEIINILS